jgi:nucleoside-diphosphate-sugar epimerase
VARESVGGAGLVIYRPSSVYGPMVQDVHRGLINNLVKNARNGRFTVLDSQVMSLRDYVYAGDIGHYVARQVVEGSAGGEGGVRFLISGRCSPIFEVVRKIQRLLHLNVYYRLDDRFGNHGHITFNPDLMPRGWRPVTLDYGISRFARVD